MHSYGQYLHAGAGKSIKFNLLLFVLLAAYVYI